MNVATISVPASGTPFSSCKREAAGDFGGLLDSLKRSQSNASTGNSVKTADKQPKQGGNMQKPTDSTEQKNQTEYISKDAEQSTDNAQNENSAVRRDSASADVEKVLQSEPFSLREAAKLLENEELLSEEELLELSRRYYGVLFSGDIQAILQQPACQMNRGELAPADEVGAVDVMGTVAKGTAVTAQTAVNPIKTEITADAALQQTSVMPQETPQSAQTPQTAQPVQTEALADNIGADAIIPQDISDKQAFTQGLTNQSKAVQGPESTNKAMTPTASESRAESGTMRQMTDFTATVRLENVRTSSAQNYEPVITEQAAIKPLIGRQVEVKSDEVRQLVQSTASDSDLNSQQKIVTAENMQGLENPALSDGMSSSGGAEKPLARLSVTEVYELIEKSSVKPGTSEMSFELTPETLGKITVKLINESGRLTVRIITENETARQLLAAKSEQLAQALKNDGVELAQYKVETEQRELFNQSFDGSSKNPYRQTRSGGEKTDEFERLLGEARDE